MNRRDGTYYFRIESMELLQRLESGLLAAEHGAEAIDELFRQAHTLKGAARAVQRDHVGDLAHTMEDVLAHHRESGAPLDTTEVSELLALLDAIRQDLTREAADAAPTVAHTPSRRSEVLRIELEEMEKLAGGLHEIEAQAGEIRAEVQRLAELRSLTARLTRLANSVDGGLASPRLRAGLDELSASLADHARTVRTASERLDIELRETTQRSFTMRLVPLAEVVPELERSAHDAARATGVNVRLTTHGTDIRLDAQVLAPLRGALVHLVRNAIAHGIEATEERASSGKPETGLVEVRFERRGGRVGVVVRDDGRGLDRTAIAQAARARGLGASEEDAESVIFEAGVSTARSVTDLAGRGVGLDAVREAVHACKGSLRVRTSRGAGTAFELDLPVSLSSTRALAVEAGERIVLIPLDFVRATRRVTEDDIVRDGTSTTLIHEDRSVPFHVLEQLTQGEPSGDAPRVAVILGTSRGTVALGVSKLHGTREVVLRPLPHALGKHRLFAGASFDRGGVPRLVLDPEGVLGSERSYTAQRKETAHRKPVLVIDDSLTTRMLEQSILEAVGYEVDVASSAEEGLKMAAAREYGIFVCDVEMPGMNGYEFTKETRARADLAKVPVIMVTSLDSAESKRRGKEAGVSTYITKSEFDQSTFLRAVAELSV